MKDTRYFKYKVVILGIIFFAPFFSFAAGISYGDILAQTADSLVVKYGNTDTPDYYPSTTALSNKTAQATPFQNTYVYSIEAATTRSVLTGTDSCEMQIQVSIDNTNWFPLKGVTPQVSGGAVFNSIPNEVSTTKNGAAIWPVSTYYPYVRIMYQHFKASCTMYPTAKLLQKTF